MQQNTRFPGKSGSVTPGLHGRELLPALFLPVAKTSTQKMAEA